MPVNILNLSGLHVLDFKESEREYHIKAEPVAVARLCPHCGRSHEVIGHGKLPLYVRDLPTHGKQVMIHLDAPRLMCKPCGKTFTATIPEVDEKRQMTERLVHWIGRQSLDYTFAAVAEQVGIDEKTVRNVFDEYAAQLKAKHERVTPRWMGMDEIYLGRARGVITNLEDHTLVDMLPDRKKETIIRFLHSLEHQEKITHVAIDMWKPYREAVHEVLPHAIVVVDKYHVIRMGNESLERVRRSLNATLPGKVRIGLKHDRKLLTMREHELNDQLHLIVSGWLRSFPLLEAAYKLKEEYFKVYDAADMEEALERYTSWEKSIPPELASAFKPIPVAWRSWRPYILNHFDDARLTNAFTESMNAKIRKMYRDGHGYSFESLRAKVLFSDQLQKRARVQEKVKVKRKRFDDVGDGVMYMSFGRMNDEYDIRMVTREINLGTDIPTLLRLIDEGQF